MKTLFLTCAAVAVSQSHRHCQAGLAEVQGQSLTSISAIDTNMAIGAMTGSGKTDFASTQDLRQTKTGQRDYDKMSISSDGLQPQPAGGHSAAADGQDDHSGDAATITADDQDTAGTSP